MSEESTVSDTGVRPIGGKKWFKNPWVLAGGGGATLALGTLAMRRRGSADTANSGVLQPANLGDAGTSGYNNLQGEIEAIQGQYSQFGSQADIDALQKQLADVQAHLSPGNQSDPPKYGLHAIGTKGKTYTWASQASRFHTTIAWLQALNPSVNRKGIPGGTRLLTPVGT